MSCPRRTFVPLLIAVLAYVLAAPAARALKDDRDQPVHVKADSVDMDEKTGVAVYRGNVAVTQGTLRIRAERVEVRLSRDRKTQTVQASGTPVRLSQRPDGGEEEIHIAARHLTYRARTREVDLSGDVRLRQGSDEFRSHTLHYELDSKRLNARGVDRADGRIHAVIHPKKTRTPAP
jgi:lipopolysaccharide export system protein LptA